MRVADRGRLAPVDEVGPKALAQIPKHVGPDLTVVVRLAEQAEPAPPAAVRPAVDLADAHAGYGVLGETRIAVDAVGEEVAATFTNRVGLDARELGVEAPAHAVMELVDDDVGVEVAVEIGGAVAVHVRRPAALAVEQEHAHDRALALGPWLEGGVVAAIGASERMEAVAACSAASEVVLLEVAGGLVEPEVVEEVVQEVHREEEMRLGGPRRPERKIEQPRTVGLQRTGHALGTDRAAKHVRVVAFQPPGAGQHGGRIAEGRRQAPSEVVGQWRAAIRGVSRPRRGGACRVFVGQPRIARVRRVRLQHSPTALRVEHAIPPIEQLTGGGVDQDVVFLGEARGLDEDLPRQAQRSLRREPDERGLYVGRKRPAIEHRAPVEPVGSAKDAAGRLELGADIGGGDPRGLFGRERDRRHRGSTRCGAAGHTDDLPRGRQVNAHVRAEHANPLDELAQVDRDETAGPARGYCAGGEPTDVRGLEAERARMPGEKATGDVLGSSHRARCQGPAARGECPHRPVGAKSRLSVRAAFAAQLLDRGLVSGRAAT